MNINKDIKQIINEQIDYYKKRAYEYDQWFMRTGRYDKGTNLNKRWFDEIKELKEILHKFKPNGEILELACGTGWWTTELARYANSITAIDSSHEVLAINKIKLANSDCAITYQQQNLFNWKPQKKFDVVFFSFWLSHIPPLYFENFLTKVSNSLKPNGRLFIIDSLLEQTATAHDQSFDNNKHINKRKLNNGKEFEIVKIFYEPKILQEYLLKLGFNITVKTTNKYFLYGRSI